MPRNVAFCGHPRCNAVWRTLRGLGAPAFLWGLASPAQNVMHLRVNTIWQALRALGTQITVEFGGPSVDHGALAFLWGLGTQIAVWVGLPRAEPEARALRKALRGERCNCASLVRFCPPRGHREPAFCLQVCQQRLSERLRAQVYNIC